jgi:hypothetical protein
MDEFQQEWQAAEAEAIAVIHRAVDRFVCVCVGEAGRCVHPMPRHAAARGTRRAARSCMVPALRLYGSDSAFRLQDIRTSRVYHLGPQRLGLKRGADVCRIIWRTARGRSINTAHGTAVVVTRIKRAHVCVTIGRWCSF